MKRALFAQNEAGAQLSHRSLQVLEKLGLSPSRALVEHLPRGYHLVSPGLPPRVRDGCTISVVGRLAGPFEVAGTFRDGDLMLLEAPFEPINARLRYPLKLKRMLSGNAVYAVSKICEALEAQYAGRAIQVSGRVKWSGRDWSMSFNEGHVFGADFDALWARLGKEKAVALPVYRLTKGVQQAEVRDAMRALVQPARSGTLDEQALEDYCLPGDVLDGLRSAGRQPVPLSTALAGLHGAYVMPLDLARDLEGGCSPFHKAIELPGAWRALAGQPRYQGSAAVPGLEMEVKPPVDELLAAWPFAPTTGQRAAVREIAEQLLARDERPRLLQGDVGSGKTAVMATVAAMMLRSGFQVAVMAPTDVLADQLYQKMAELVGRMPGFTGEDTVVRYATGMKAPQKRAFKALSKGARPFVAVGTHGLSGQEFGRLGLVILDEEQRFSAAVKGELNARYPGAYQMLVSATPIPRTLASAIYAGCQVTTLPDKPANRIPITTSIVNPENAEERVLKAVEAAAGRGEQVYVVCPAVESDAMASVEAAHEWLSQALPRSMTIDVIHGAMTAVKADEALRTFKEGRTQVLIGTTILAVGVDVPNASLMVVLDPHMMGVSQLHQIRGRVGRGGLPGECLLIPTRPLNERQQQGLEYIAQNADGFALAEYDLAMRGEGDFSGHDQSGHGIDWSFLAEEAQIMVEMLERRRSNQMDLDDFDTGGLFDATRFR